MFVEVFRCFKERALLLVILTLWTDRLIQKDTEQQPHHFLNHSAPIWIWQRKWQGPMKPPTTPDSQVSSACCTQRQCHELCEVLFSRATPMGYTTFEAFKTKRHQGDSNPCGQSPMDFESISLTTRTQCHVYSSRASNLSVRNITLNTYIRHLTIYLQIFFKSRACVWQNLGI